MTLRARGVVLVGIAFFMISVVPRAVFAQCSPPAIVSEPADITVSTGQPATFTVEASGTAPLNYQWYLGIAGDISTPVGTNSPIFTTGSITSPVEVWVQISNACGTTRSLGARAQADCFLVAPDIFGPPIIGPGVPYEVRWTDVPGASLYEIHESTSPDFASFNAFATRLNSASYVHDAAPSEIVPYFYRVRTTFNCQGVPHGSVSISSTLRVIVEAPAPPAPLPLEGIEVMAPAGDETPLKKSFLLLPPEGASRALFTATTDRPWLSVEPASGEITASGTVLTVTSLPVTLPEGTTTGTLTLGFEVPDAAKRFVPTGSSTASVPVSTSVVAGVSPIGKDTFPPENTLIIPAVAHVEGGGARFVSDVRIANTSSRQIRYQLTFTPTGANLARAGLRNTITVGPGQTAALNDIVKQWFGVGLIEAGGASGSLEIRAENFAGKIDAETHQRSAFATVGSSRTYAKTSEGTFGQYIPALPFGRFIGQTGVSPTPGVLSLQQVSESPAFRTNLGLVEASGQPATVEISVFSNSGGAPIAVFTESLLAHEHRQMNQYLASKGISLPDGRIEVRVLSGTGRVSAYASVIDNVTADPLLVEPADLTQSSGNTLVLPGVADIKTGQANWRSDMRVFNPDDVPVEATLTFHPSGNPDASVDRVVTIGAGEVLVLDNLLEETFSATGTGAVRVQTAAERGLVVTARTYDQREVGTYGQFIPAVTPANAIGMGERSLEVLQLEQSERFRSNLGLVEMIGEPVTVEISTLIPGRAAAPIFFQQLKANEFVQLNSVISSRLGIENAYNARVTIRVVSGTGKVAAYGSIIDNLTQDPTYVPSQ